MVLSHSQSLQYKFFLVSINLTMSFSTSSMGCVFSQQKKTVSTNQFEATGFELQAVWRRFRGA
jgi:hypothetical protein